MISKYNTDDLPPKVCNKIIVTDHWEWTTPSSLGYGPHRKIWELLVGKIPKGMDLDHLCKVKRCVDPSHLEVVTHGENICRGNTQAMGSFNREKTHCKNGHEFTKENTYIAPSNPNNRKCRICQIMWRKRSRERKRQLS